MRLKPPMILSGSANLKLAKDIVDLIPGATLIPCANSRFADTEIQIRIDESVSNRTVFLIQSLCRFWGDFRLPTDARVKRNLQSVNDAFMEAFIILDALVCSGVQQINMVIPYLGYERQDKQDRPRQPISARLVMDLLEAAANGKITRYIFADLHAAQIKGFTRNQCDNIYTRKILVKRLQEMNVGKFVLVSPDPGAKSRSLAFAKELKCDLAMGSKTRQHDKANALVKEITKFDPRAIRGRNCIIAEDMVDTAGTVDQTVESLIRYKPAGIYVLAPHGIFSDPAEEHDETIKQRIARLPVKKFIITDTVPLPDALVNNPKIEVVSIAPLLAEVIKRRRGTDSVSVLFE